MTKPPQAPGLQRGPGLRPGWKPGSRNAPSGQIATATFRILAACSTLVAIGACSILSKPSGDHEVKCATPNRAEDPCRALVPPMECSITTGAEGVCQPVPDICNGIDDDQDGIIDEGRPEECNLLDDDCDGERDEGAAPVPDRQEVCNNQDDDCDGLTDENASPSPEACDGVDNDCDTRVDEDVSATELCNGVDDDCDGPIDEGFNVDGDQYYVCGTICATCNGCMNSPGSDSTPPCTLEPQARDCNDTDPEIYPGAPERCDRVDRDCDTLFIPTDPAAGDALCQTMGLAFCEEVRGCVPDDCEALRATQGCGPTEVCDNRMEPPRCVVAGCTHEACEQLNMICNITTGDCQPRAQLGQPCLRDEECESGICAERDTLGFSGVGSICIQPCCNDSSCSPEHFCWDAANGATSCLPVQGFETETGRTALGSKVADAACAGNAECMSGLCNNGRCLATCRHDMECPGDLVCGTVQRVMDGKAVLGCVSGRVSRGQVCMMDATNCAVGGCGLMDGLIISDTCRERACRHDGDCVETLRIPTIVQGVSVPHAYDGGCSDVSLMGNPVRSCSLGGSASGACCSDAPCGGGRCRPVGNGTSYPMHCTGALM